jgi:hypothetical protein
MDKQLSGRPAAALIAYHEEDLKHPLQANGNDRTTEVAMLQTSLK